MLMKSSRVFEALKIHPVFAAGSEAELKKLCAAAQGHELKRGDVILREHEASQCVYLLSCGIIGIYYTNDDGLELLVKVLPAPVIFGEMEILTELNRQEEVRCLEPSTVVSIDGKHFINYLEDNGRAAVEKLKEMSRWLAISTHLERGLAFNRVDMRIADFLFQLALVKGEQDGPWTKIALSASYDTIACALGVTNRSVERTIGPWKRAGWVRKNEGRFEVQLEALRAHCDPECLALRDSFSVVSMA